MMAQPDFHVVQKIKKSEAMKFIFGTLGYLQVIFTQVRKRIWPCVPKALKGMSKCIKNADCILATYDSVDFSLFQTLFQSMPHS